MQTAHSDSSSIPLPSGIRFPPIGYGTYDLREKEVTASAVVAALEAGYRLIDTAADYGNEEGIGEGVRRSAIARSEIWVSSNCRRRAASGISA